LSYASKRLLYKTIFFNTGSSLCQGLFGAPSGYPIDHRDNPCKKKITIHYSLEP